MRTYQMLGLLAIAVGVGCNNAPMSVPTGIRQVAVSVKPQASGLTIEQENIAARLKADNQPGSIKHLYVISAFSGDVLVYSTVKGKVTSSGKRLTPTSVAAIDGEFVDYAFSGMGVTIGGATKQTTEVLQDDGTYGYSVEYLYWWDVQGRYHQHYPGGGQIIHISDQPLPIGKAIINMEIVK